MLESLSKFFELVVYTSATREYMEVMMSLLDPRGNLFSTGVNREDTPEFTEMGVPMLKDLNILLANRSIDNIVIVDNRPEGVFLNFENYVPILNFDGLNATEFDIEKQQMNDLTNYLLSFHYTSNFKKRIVQDFKYEPLLSMLKAFGILF